MPLLPVEPPGEDVPGGAGEGPAQLGPVRVAAAAAALAFAVAGRGHGALLAALLAVLLAYPVGIATAALAAVATAARWGSPWLVAIGGAQAVLGPGGVVGPEAAAASAWLAAGALLLATPGPSILAALATSATAALLVAGPAGTDGIPTRLAATVLFAVVALVIGHQRRRRVPAVAGLVLAALAAVLALV